MHESWLDSGSEKDILGTTGEIWTWTGYLIILEHYSRRGDSNMGFVERHS